jgi:ketosteroid isomerase-like protein
MKSLRVFIAVVAALSVIVAPAEASSQAERELLQANEQYDRAIMGADVAALERIFADEFIYTNPKAEVLDKKQQIAALSSADFKLTEAASDDVRIRVYGNTAVMTGRFTAKTESGGKSEMIEERYTAVWVRRDGRWELVAEQGNLKK